MSSWSVDIDVLEEQTRHLEEIVNLHQSQDDVDCQSSCCDNESNAEASPNNSNRAAPIIIPSAKQIRKNTEEGLKYGVLPEYQDYGVLLKFLVKRFLKHDFDFNLVVAEVPWLVGWLKSPFNERLLNEELELAAKLEAGRIQRHMQFMLNGGICTRTIGRCCNCLCCCFPIAAVACRVCTYCGDLCLSCLWSAFCDWWLGVFCRRFILTYLCYIPKWCKLKLEDLLIGESMFDDEELSIRNIYDSNSYRIANQYACLLLLAMFLTLLGACVVAVSYIYMPQHPDKLFVRFESGLGIFLLTMGCFGLQFYCRCTL